MRRAIPAAIVAAAAAAAFLLWRADPAGGPGGPASLPDVPRPAEPAQVVPAVPAPARAAGVLVLDADGQPAEGATVDLLASYGHAAAEPEPVPLGVTDAAGRVSWPPRDLAFPGLVRALHPERGGGEVAVSSAADCTVRLLRPLTLRGVVVSGEGAPVAGASVETRFEPATRALGPVIGTSGTWIAHATSGEDGAFAFRGLPPPSSVLLTARKEGWLDGHASWGTWRGAEIRIVVHRPFRARVRVRDQAGEPVDGASVAVSGGGRLVWKEGFAGRAVVALPGIGDGEYSREDLAPGWFHVIAAKPGFRVRIPTLAALHPDREPAEIRLEAAEDIDGRVMDADSGAPIPDAVVAAIPFLPGAAPGAEWTYGDLAAAAGEALATRSGADGTFRVTVAGPGDPVLLTATRDGYEPNGGRLSELLRKGRVEIALRPRTVRALTGRVVSQDGTPVAGGQVRWSEGAATTGPDGRFRIEGFSDTLVTALAPGFLHEAVRVDAAAANLGDIALRALRTLRGVVREEDGTPVPGIQVGAHAPRAGAGTPGVTDDAGGVVLSVPSGEDVEIVPWGTDRKGTTRVPAGSEEPFLLVVTGSALADAGTIRGRVVLPDGGMPMEYGSATAKAEEAGAGGTVTMVAYEPDGSFFFARVPAGRWTVGAWTLGGFRGEASGVVVPPKGTVEVMIRLEKTAAPTEKPPPRVDVEVRPLPEPGEDDAHRLKAWATSWKTSKSAEAPPSKDGKFRVPMREEEAFAVWVHDSEGKRSGVATADAPSAERPVEVHLVPAGWIVLPPDPEMPERWVVLRDARGTPVYSGFEASLPGVAGEGYRLVVPPGAWTVTLSRGLARRDPLLVRVTVSPGEGTRAE